MSFALVYFVYVQCAETTAVSKVHMTLMQCSQSKLALQTFRNLRLTAVKNTYLGRSIGERKKKEERMKERNEKKVSKKVRKEKENHQNSSP